ncbi:MAG: T9SS type A sorting domain-containing protein, partial [Calditrichota bacterium]
TIVYNLAEWPAWVKLTPASGAIEPQGSLPLTLSFNAAGLEGGSSQEGYFVIEGGQRGGPDTLRVIMEVHPAGVGTEPDSPQPTAWSLSLHPNPVNSILLVEVIARPRTKMNLGLFDVMGRRILNRDLILGETGKEKAIINLEGLPSSLYLVRLGDGKNQIMRRVVLLK